MISLAMDPVSPGASRSPLTMRIIVAVAFALLIALGLSAALHESAAASSPMTITNATLVGAATNDAEAHAAASPSATTANDPEDKTAALTPGPLTLGPLTPTDAAVGCCLLGAACCLLLLIVLARGARRRTAPPMSLVPRPRLAPVTHGRRAIPALTLSQLSVLRT